ncbi:hypothetical protein M011DRAFT_402076 [Sporormia fimetaria CBS 119925]|uniref:tRNA(Phe) (4-demethylwyosine(37)-C(7)) aminocarboxypropyltransferase n=1 Tax=Sporormia fimetaria CBS 119925 TaxID=1340428 RepID=A0A6A6VF94_9PLEO|nr:hypothetical protein M011DRAFT_402076 [Sporormia fimetaria CBS 119925]
MEASRLALLVPREIVKRVKSALEEEELFDRNYKICDVPGYLQDATPRKRLVTTISVPNKSGDETSSYSIITDLLHDLELRHLLSTGTIQIRELEPEEPQIRPTTKNPLLKALQSALDDLPQSILSPLGLTSTTLVSTFPTTYTLYPPLLLLPPGTFSSPPWTKLNAAYDLTTSPFTTLWTRLASSIGATHVAINSGIPPSTSSSADTENVLRSPLNLTPLSGTFGPPPTPSLQSSPTPSDFTSAFWVSCTQNGIYQTWAPLYTMFSRGNIKEKTRVLKFPDLQHLRKEGKTCTVVDLYAGIGYFSFSYRKAGCCVGKVVCWELNPWSIEGLRRGAERNGWGVFVMGAGDVPQTEEGWRVWRRRNEEGLKGADFIMFQCSNERALEALEVLASILSPVRHVNCGFLPSSRGSWKTAVTCLDRREGGWVHVHENVGVEEVGERQEEVVSLMQRFVEVWERGLEDGKSRARTVRCTHVERVKTYAPGVLHVVYDVHVSGTEASNKAV